ncbi:conjugal transfer protein TraF [uncultured Sphingomonas sp.]|uniref:conjugal transfer protein TraF n=1 Tax=uncultured Sphingomonas sp. TaxID=158754 RepID=UPI0026346A3F|nr:conjugal transfer protein TraF [uncultured Sphingomonas sp.]
MRAPLTLALILSLAASGMPSTAANAQLVDSVSRADAPESDQAAPEAEPSQLAEQAGDDFYCRERRLGEWFYCEKPKAKPSQQRAEQPAQSSSERLAAISKQLEEMKARAILEPTTENISAYISYQREQLNRASSFADMWRRTIWQNPELDYTLQRPVNQLGKRTWLDSRTADKNRVLSSISKRYGVFYFYSSACAACEVFGPIMRSVSDRFGLTVMAVSLDGGPSKAFPNFTVDTGQYRAMGMQGQQVPALVLFDTQTKRPMPIGYGVMAADEVMDRIFTLTSVEPGSDF